MPVGTVRGRYELDAPALRTLKELERQGIRTQKQMRELGQAIDKVAGADDAARIKTYEQRLEGLRRTSQRDLRMYREEWRRTTLTVRAEVDAQQRAIHGLELSLDRLGSRRVSPQIDLDGVTAALAQVTLLEQRLNALSGRRATPRVALGGGFSGGGFGGGGGGGGGGGFSTRGGGILDFGRRGISPRNLAIGGLLAYSQPLIGGAGALLGSASSGLLGAGALAAPALGGAAMGFGGVFATIKPMSQPISDAAKAMAAYNEQVALYGKLSDQARLAKTKLDIAMSNAPPGTRDLLRATTQLRSTWSNVTRPGQEALIGSGVFGLQRLNRFARGAGGRAVNRVDRAFGREGRNFARFLTGAQGARFARQGAGIFDENFGNVEGATEGAMTAFLNVMQAARPFFRESTAWLDRWTHGWADGTSNIERTRHSIRTMTDDLKAWGRLGGAGFRLIRDLFARGRQPGTNMVEDLTGTLNRWDRWVRGHGREVDDFFARSVHSVELMASGITSVVHTLSQLLTLLQPILDRFSQLVGLAATLSSTSPFTLPAIYGAARGIRGGMRGGGRGGGLGGGGGGGGVPGGGFFALGRSPIARGAGGVRSTYQLARGFGYGRGASAAAGLGSMFVGGGAAARGLAGRAIGGAVGVLGPMAVLGGVLGAANASVGGVSGRAAGALSGLSFGLIRQPRSDAEIADAGFRGDAAYINRGLRGAHGGTPGQIAYLRRVRGQYTNLADPHERSIRDQINQEIAARKQLIRTIRSERDARSRQEARTHFRQFMEGYRTRLPREGQVGAFGSTVSGVLGDLPGMRDSGARTLAQQTLDWANQARAKNPALQREYDRLVRGVQRRFRDLKNGVTVINGQILDGTARQWNTIADQIAGAARRGVSETSAEFQRLRAIAMGDLKLMGFSERDAAALFRSVTSGGARGRAASNVISATQTGGIVAATDRGVTGMSTRGTAGGIRRGGGTGDGIGDGPGDPYGKRAASTARTSRARGFGGSPGLMGAKAGLQGYANEGSRFGLHVSSGLRPGAITSSGNTSYHASGDAIDVAGPADRMLAFARYMSRKYGAGLDELIHTPLGRGQIKNGHSYVYSGAVAADHYDHVHIADRTPGRAMGGGGFVSGPGGMAAGITLSGRRSRLGGVPGAMSTAASAGIARGMEAAVNAAIGASGGGGASRGKYNRTQLAQLWVQAGGNPAVANLMASLAIRESGGNPNAINHNTNGTIDRGLWQINSIWGKWSRFGGLSNAESAVHVYNTQGPQAWATYNAATDARYLGGFRRGGRFVTRAGRPGLFMAGEGPNREEVIVRPHRPARKNAGGFMSVASGGGVNVSVSVSVSMAHVAVRDEADIEALAERVGEKVGEKLLVALSDASDKDLLDD